VAEISVERKPRSPLPLILGVLLLAAVAFVVWKYVGGEQDAGADAPAVVDSVAR
jgi:hypothetical protein